MGSTCKAVVSRREPNMIKLFCALLLLLYFSSPFCSADNLTEVCRPGRNKDCPDQQVCCTGTSSNIAFHQCCSRKERKVVRRQTYCTRDEECVGNLRCCPSVNKCCLTVEYSFFMRVMTIEEPTTTTTTSQPITEGQSFIQSDEGSQSGPIIEEIQVAIASEDDQEQAFNHFKLHPETTMPPATPESDYPGSNHGSDPGSNHGSDPGSNHGSDPGSDPGSNHGSDPGPNYDLDLGMDSRIALSVDPQTRYMYHVPANMSFGDYIYGIFNYYWAYTMIMVLSAGVCLVTTGISCYCFCINNCSGNRKLHQLHYQYY